MDSNLAKKKSKTKDEKNWLNKISNFGCVVCRKHYEIDDAPPANCHHIRQGMGAGQKNSHYMVLPLCWEHHQGQDDFIMHQRLGKRSMELKQNF